MSVGPGAILETAAEITVETFVTCWSTSWSTRAAPTPTATPSACRHSPAASGATAVAEIARRPGTAQGPGAARPRSSPSIASDHRAAQGDRAAARPVTPGQARVGRVKIVMPVLLEVTKRQVHR